MGFVSWILILGAVTAKGNTVHYIPEIGEHHKIITFKKNENPQNILVVYTKLDSKCHFIADRDDKPPIDFYWLMDGAKYKPTHSLIKKAVRQRLKITHIQSSSFTMRVTDLTELGTKIEKPDLIVKVEKKNGACDIASYFSDDQRENKLIQVTELYSESKKILLPPFRKLLAVTVSGTASDSGVPVQRRYSNY